MWSTCHKHGTKKKSESATGIDFPYTGRISVALTLSYKGLVASWAIYRFVWFICIWPARHESIVVQWLEYLSGVRKVSGSIPLGDSVFFFVRCSWHVDHNASHFFTELKINHLSLFITTIVMPPVLRNSSIAWKNEFESCIFFFRGSWGRGRSTWILLFCQFFLQSCSVMLASWKGYKVHLGAAWTRRGKRPHCNFQGVIITPLVRLI